MTIFIRKRAHRWVTLLIVLTVTAASLLQLVNIKPVFASYSNTYPWGSAPCAASGSNLGHTTGTGYWCTGYNWGENPCPSGDTFCTTSWLMNGYYLLDKWGEGFRNCTSYTAWTLNQVFGINTTNWGNGADWNNSAHTAGYTNDTSPQKGDIAQWNSPAPFGHVAYVYDVVGGVAKYAEYNYPQDGTYQDTYTSSTQGAPDKWIHIGTVTTVTADTSRPAVLTRSSDSMDVFYRSTTHQLIEQGWNATNSWGGLKTAASSGVSSNPTADTRTSDSMDAFYRDTSNNLEVVGWSATGDWTGPTAIITDGSVNGDPVVIAPDSNHMWVFYKDSTSRLMDKKWDNVNGWASPHIDISSSSVASSPSAIVLDANNFFVFYRNTSGNMDEIGYSSGTWSGPSTRANNVQSDFTAISRTSTSLDLFYKASGGGLGNVGYSSGSWSDYEWTVGNTIATSGNSFRGSPLAIKRDSNNMSVFYQDNQNNLVEKAWNGTTGWAAPYNRASNIYDNPGGVSRSSDSMDTLFRDGNANLISQGWSTAGGWAQGGTGAANVD